MSKTHVLTRMIAESMIQTRSFRASFEKATVWPDGSYGKIHICLSNALSDADTRKAIAKVLFDLLRSSEVGLIRFVCAGRPQDIGPATLLALELNRPMLVQHRNEYYSVDIPKAKEFVKANLTELVRSADAIAGILPINAIFGIIAAEETSQPLFFIIQEEDEKGRVEGHATDSEGIPKIALMETYNEKGLGRVATGEEALQSAGMEILARALHTDVSEFIQPVPEDELKRKRIVSVSDVIGIDDSVLKNVESLQKCGVEVIVATVFDYHFEESKRKFKTKGIMIRQAVKFIQLMRVLGLTIESEKKFWEWHSDLNRSRKPYLVDKKQ